MTEPDPELKSLIKKRGVIKAKQTIFKNRFQAIKEDVNKKEIAGVQKEVILELESRVQNLENGFQEFDEVQGAIEMLADENALDEHLTYREEFENTYYKLSSDCKKIIDDYYQTIKSKHGGRSTLSRSPVNSIVIDDPGDNYSVVSASNAFNNQPHCEIRLPPISLPHFSGDYRNWLEFRDFFISIVHSKDTIPNINKFHYLRSALEAGAAQVIRSIEFSGDNYQLAWETLCNRYDNKAVLVQNHMKSLFSLPALSAESAPELRKMVDKILKHLQSLKSLNLPTDSWDILLIYIFSQKLDKKTAREWEEHKVSVSYSKKKSSNLGAETGQLNGPDNNVEVGGSGDLPTLKEFVQFIKQKADLLETIELTKEQKSDRNSDHRGEAKHSNSKRSFSYTVTNQTCCFCDGPHFLQYCPTFEKLPVNSRQDKVRELKLCYNCLKPGHGTKFCRSGGCKRCHLKHNTLLHFSKISENKGVGANIPNVSNTNEVSSDASLTMSMARSGCESNSTVLLQTALIQVLDCNGVPRECRALLDSASQSNLMTTECCSRLGLEKLNLPSAVIGVGENVSQLKYRCKAKIQSCHNNFQTDLSCLVIPKISGMCPSTAVSRVWGQIPNHLRLADPRFDKPADIDILIGGGVYLSLLCIGQIPLGPGLPTLQKTKFGWVVGGEVQSSVPNKSFQCNFLTDENIQSQLAKFWEIEEISTSEKVFSEDDKKCEEIFVSTTTRAEDGRFVVQIPFKKSPECLGDSKQRASNRFRSLETKLGKIPSLKVKYSEFLSEYKTLGHMVEVKNPSEPVKSYYFPHHAVINEKSPTTKLRVVFDGSCESDSGVSLNSLQYVGPTLQDELTSLILRFRQHSVVVGADIVKMYRQILIDPDQRCFQRIFWRDDPSQEIKTFELKTVTYGTSSAPFLAVRCLKELAKENESAYPEAAKIINRDFYMDDMLTGTDNVTQAIQLCEQVATILRSGCFELQKWSSNCKEVLEHFSSSSSLIIFGEKERTKTLGLYWECEQDLLRFNIKEGQLKSVTKRIILSEVSQIFDPLGLLGPCVILAKIMLQRLWLYKITWDESLPSDLDSKWRVFRSQLEELNKLEIPRQVVCNGAIRVELHGFSDASLEAYGACVYIRSITADGQVGVQLLCSKTRVSPLKSLTVPRLELCAALVLARLVEKVKSSLTLDLDETFLWCDSTVCLSWIRTQPNILQTFVSNRVSQIQSVTKPSEWNHISTSDNPADVLSRGLYPEQIESCEMWWHGPKWLTLARDSWPQSKFRPVSEVPELKKQAMVFKIIQVELFPFQRFSSFSKMVRIMAWCIRFIDKCRKIRGFSPHLTADELSVAQYHLVNLSQKESFADELHELSKGVPCTKGKLLSLNPFLDSKNTLRVGGRLQLSNCDYEKKHPAVLSSSHHLTKLLFVERHLDLLHAGPQLLLASIRETFWPIAGRNLARKVTRECVRCFRSSPSQKNPIMGILPEPRVSPTLPFSNVGVDYAGPLTIKDRKGRGAKLTKCYIALFVCLCTKAVHIELVSELSTAAFLAAFTRFSSRRGKPLNVYSDNGSNFIGAKNELEELGRFLKDQKEGVSESVSRQGVTWHFIPALSPHFGGIWEAGIKSCKTHLKRVLGNAKLTFEGLSTVLTEIEAVLNSRPLIPLSSDPSDLTALTPSHFLMGKTITSLPERDFTMIPENRLSYYESLQQLKQHFWTRWSLEYVSELQVRTKWQKPNDVLQAGDLVVVKDHSLPLQWPLGRIISVQPGPDGVARVAVIKTNKGLCKRSFAKICPLPKDSVFANSV